MILSINNDLFHHLRSMVYILSIQKMQGEVFFKIIHNTLQSATKFVEPLFSAALKNELKNLPHLETQYHYNPIPFPAFRLIYQGGIGQSKGIEAKTIQKCCTLNDNALATVSQSVGRSLVQTIFRSTLSSGKFTRYSILKHIL